jgi:hypothetical protein
MYSLAKAVISGSIAEVYLYKLPIEYGYEQPKVHKSNLYENSEEEKQENKIRSLQQTKRALRNVLQSNGWQYLNDQGKPCIPLFITLTFRENVKDLSVAHREFKIFVQRFNFRFHGRDKANIRYLAVPEFQKRGAVHYHVIFFNLSFIKNIYDEINALWGNGFTLVETVKTLSHLVNYVAKYITAEALDERLAGRKRFFTSKGLNKPLEIRDEKIVEDLLAQLPRENIRYKNMYLGNDGQQTEYVNYEFGLGQKVSDLVQLNRQLV